MEREPSSCYPERALVYFLTGQEAQALLDSPDRLTASGRRDHALLTLAIQTGLRVSETPPWAAPIWS